VLGVGSIPSVTLGSSGYQSQSTNVPVNGAYILAEDQNGVGAQFGSSYNYFDYGSGTKNTIAQTSENFVTASGNFSITEQDSLVSQQLTGVCSSSSSGCTSNFGLQTSINTYKLYPPSSADVYARTGTADSGCADGKFWTKGTSTACIIQGAIVLTGASNSKWWTRSPSRDSARANNLYATTGQAQYPTGGTYTDVNYGYSFRPAGVFHLRSLNVCLPQTFRSLISCLILTNLL
jgi:hypothetical protein